MCRGGRVVAQKDGREVVTHRRRLCRDAHSPASERGYSGMFQGAFWFLASSLFLHVNSSRISKKDCGIKPPCHMYGNYITLRLLSPMIAGPSVCRRAGLKSLGNKSEQRIVTQLRRVMRMFQRRTRFHYLTF